MIALEPSNYLGQVDRYLHWQGISASVTSYPDEQFAGSMHYHEMLHLSFIAKGGNLEKRKQTAIERLPGTVTFYEAGEPHQSTRIMPGSRHVNLEIANTFCRIMVLTPMQPLLEK